MTNVELVVNNGIGWSKVDLYGDEVITLNKQISNIEFEGLRQTDYSETFNLPDTNTNKIFFKNYFELNSNVDFQSWDAYLYSNGYIIARGKIQPQRITYVNFKKSLEIVFYGEAIDFFTSLNDKLCDMDFTDVDNYYLSGYTSGGFSNVMNFVSYTGKTNAIGSNWYSSFFADAYDPTYIGYPPIQAGFLDYNNNLTYDDFSGTTYVGMGRGTAQQFLYSGYTNFWTPSSPNVTATTATTYSKSYGKSGFYLGWNYNMFFNNSYLLSKIVNQAGYKWSQNFQFRASEPLYNSLLLYKDLTKPGTNQYWFKQSNIDTAAFVETTGNTYTGVVGNGNPLSLNSFTGSIFLIDENQNIVASSPLTNLNSITGVFNTTETSVQFQTMNKLYLTGLTSGYYGLGISGSCSIGAGSAAFLITWDKRDLFTQIDRDNTGLYATGTTGYLFNGLPNNYLKDGSFFYDGQDGIFCQIDINHTLKIKNTNLITKKYDTEYSIDDNSIIFQFGVIDRFLRPNYCSMLPDWTQGQYISEMIKLHNLFFEIDNFTKNVTLSPYRYYYNTDNGVTEIRDYSNKTNWINTIEVEKENTYGTFIAGFNLNTDLPYYNTYLNDFIFTGKTENPTQQQIINNQYIDNTLQITCDFDGVLSSPWKGLMFIDRYQVGTNITASTSYSALSQSFTPVLMTPNEYDGVMIGQVNKHQQTFVNIQSENKLIIPNDSFLTPYVFYINYSDTAVGYRDMTNKTFNLLYVVQEYLLNSVAYPVSRLVAPFNVISNIYPVLANNQNESQYYDIGIQKRLSYTQNSQWAELNFNTNTQWYNSQFYKVNYEFLNLRYEAIDTPFIPPTTYGVTSEFSLNITQNYLSIYYYQFLSYDIDIPNKFRRIKISCILTDNDLSQLDLQDFIYLWLENSYQKFTINNLEINLNGKNTCVLDLIQYNY